MCSVKRSGFLERIYYFKNLFIGLVLFAICVYASKSSGYQALYFIVACISAFLFPLSKRLIENIAFRYAGKDVWSSAPLMTGARSGGYALLWLLCFGFAIPLGGGYLIWLCVKK
ncbi:colicin E1 family microcin immunity protein [Pseudomonas reactans]|uniref:colicin E1 family microcin immunity protein n=1 Tax=Pseudomonas reactans TaxID=117680 RepID=UPI0031B5A697